MGNGFSSAFLVAEGYRHDVGFYSSDDDFRELILPFARGGPEAGEPVVFAYDAPKMALLREWLSGSSLITYLEDGASYATPTKTLAHWRTVVEGYLAQGATRVRIAGDVPHPGNGRPFVGWDRYEAALDRGLGDLPVWFSCLYDTRTASPEVLAAATQRHRFFLERDGTQRANGSFVAARGLADFLADPVQPRGAPDVQLTDPTADAVRTAARQLARGRLTIDQRDDVLLAVTETVANATTHGVPPVTVDFWADEDEVVISIHDHGAGPTDPFVGLLQLDGPRAHRGRGLWLLHQLDLEVAMDTTHGFRVTLRAGRKRAGT